MDPRVVITALLNEFGTIDRPPTAEEARMIDYIKNLLKSDMEIVDEIQTLGFDEGHNDEWNDDMDFGDDVDQTDEPMSLQPSQASSSSTSTSQYCPTPPKKPKCTGPEHMSEAEWEDYKQKAYLFWTHNPKTGVLRDKRATASSVQNQFRFISTMSILYNYEKNAEQTPVSFRNLNEAVLKLFKLKEAEGVAIHDRTLRIWAMQLKKSMDPENSLDFKASSSWVYRFKKRNNIVDRAITHRVSRNWKDKDMSVRQLSDQFVTDMKNLIVSQNFHPEQILNADQSRFEKELHGHRTLRTKGSLKVRTVAGSITATTHSYMIMPVITVAGEILRPMFVLISESVGKFPLSKPVDPVNIKSYAGTSANMNKEDLKRFYSEVFWPSIPSDRKKVLLFLDSWAANRDDHLSDSLKPKDVEFEKRLIPGGCTGKIQPLDVHFFRMYKSFIRFITDTVVMENEINIWHRDRFLALQAFTIYQFSATRFKNMIKYAFYISGYLIEKPGSWVSPHIYCFDSIDTDKCWKCDELAFVKCAHCENVFCINHALFNELHIDCNM